MFFFLWVKVKFDFLKNRFIHLIILVIKKLNLIDWHVYLSKQFISFTSKFFVLLVSSIVSNGFAQIDQPYSYDACCDFLQTNSLLSIIRAHEAQDAGLVEIFCLYIYTIHVSVYL